MKGWSRTSMKSLHELEDEIIECGGVLYGRNEGDQLALNLASVDPLRGVQVSEHGSIEV